MENIAGAHWLAFVRRSDVPLCWAALDPAPALGSEDTSPNDVMLLAKTFMSDANLMQPLETMLRAGASAVLQPFAGPDAWEYRKEIDVKGINRLCKKVEDHIPSRAAVVPYLKTWMAQPRVPPMPVPEPACLQYRCRDQARLDLEQAISRALHRPASESAKPLVVKRRRCTCEDYELHANLTLEQYVASRKSQGVLVADAVREFNGRQALLWSARG